MAEGGQFYNWGYGLCIAINDGLPNAIPSANNMANMLWKRKSGSLGLQSDYYSVTTLYDAAATYENVITAILDLAAKSIAGDIVTIYFGLHGEARRGENRVENFNRLLLHDYKFFTEDELYALLRLFSEDVRVVVVMDICQSGTWLNELTIKDDCVLEKVCNSMINKSVNYNCSKSFQNAIVKLKPMILASPLVSTVTIIGAISDSINISDSDCFASFLTQTWSKDGNLWKDMESLIRRVREVAFERIVDKPVEVSGGCTRWKMYYVDYCELVLKCPISEDYAPSYDYNNQHHQEAMRHFLPTINFLGPHHDKYSSYKAFCVN